MSVYELDPLSDPRWPELLQADSRASVFHSRPWLEALRRTYGYTPLVLTTCAPQQALTNGILLCRVNSWLTGARLVSLPFSDHCDLLVHRPEQLEELTAFVSQLVQRRRLKYVELRPLSAFENSEDCFRESERFWFHALDLRPATDDIFRGLHKNSFQRKIMRADREGLSYERGATRDLAKKFYRLFAMTRKRHGVPPPPISWIFNLLECLARSAEIRVASKDGRPVAGMLTLTYKQTVVYKYGGSDERFNNLGGTAFLFWKMIVEAKQAGAQTLDLGRCDSENRGLIRYKDRLGSRRSVVKYWRVPLATFPAVQNGWKIRMAKQLFSHSPQFLCNQVGNRLYRHAG